VATVTQIGAARGAKPSGLEAIQALVGADLAAVNQEIVRRMHSRVPLIPQLASHIVQAGGKRVRPLLTLAAARLCGYEGTKHTLLAACVEFIHTATLLHDDVVDESELRRGNATANTLWGNEASVLVGDFLFSRAFQLMVETGQLEILRILANASATIAEGEVMQLTTANDTATTEDSYLEVIAAKTAALFAAACRVGGVVAGCSAAQADALDSFGRNLGIAFQLIDDALDYAADQAALGKTVGDDFREGKITLPVILAFRRGDEEERTFWRRTQETLEQTPDDLERAQALMQRHGAIRDTVERARHYAALAHRELEQFPDGPAREALHAVVDFSVDRAF
jgi:octaprenyl-diphosphate synthase